MNPSTRKSSSITWDRVKGLESVCEALIESVITPIKYPKLFEQSAVRPWKCILLHGPPGNLVSIRSFHIKQFRVHVFMYLF